MTPDYASPQHRGLRAAWGRRIAMGGVSCWRCGEPIPPGSKWHLGHDDRGRVHVGPEHVKCNVAAANRLRAADARRYRQGEPAGAADEADRAFVKRALARNPNAYEDPDWPGVVIYGW